MLQRFMLLIILLNAVLLSSYASAFIEIISKEIPTRNLEKLNIFLNENLPQKLINRLDRKIELSSSNFDNNDFTPVCFEKITEDLKLVSNVNSNEIHRQIRGKSYPTQKKGKNHRIQIHSRLMSELIRNNHTISDESSMRYNCGHRSLYRLALATVIHEIAHIYDAFPKLDYSEKMYVSACEFDRLSQDPGQEETLNCKISKELKLQISSRKSYKMLTGFFSDLDEQSKNMFPVRSPDPYELQNSEEHFATNFEYYILDPEYKCRRPALFSYLQNHFTEQRSSAVNCDNSKSILLNSSGITLNYRYLVNFDSKKLYQIHYFFAGKGGAAMSKWGHAMLRFAFCSPERTSVGPECLKDTNYHLVVSFRANVSDLILDYRKGIFGGYPSKVFIYQLNEIINEYAVGELRDLTSYPLKLTREQIDQFTNRVLELYWEYAGNYYFISNNCATETFDLIKSIFNKPYLTYEKVYTPLGITELLERHKLVDTSFLSDLKLAEKNHLYYPSFSRELNLSFDRLINSGFKINDRNKFIEETSAIYRRALLLNFLDSLPTNPKFSIDPFIQSSVPANLARVESRIKYLMNQKRQNLLFELIDKLEKNEINLSDANQKEQLLEHKRLIVRNVMQTPQMRTPLGEYGVPPSSSISEYSEFRVDDIFKKFELVDTLKSKKLLDLIEEIKVIDSNIRGFRKITAGIEDPFKEEKN